MDICVSTGEPCRRWRQWQSQPAPYALPESGTPVLVLSDLGCYQSAADVTQAWVRWGRRLTRSGSRPVALMPCPKRLWDEPLLSAFFPVCWDRAERLPRKRFGNVNEPLPHRAINKGVDSLLTRLSPAIRVESGLLRAARRQMSAQDADVGSEAEAWLHAHTKATASHFTYANEAQQRYRTQFALLDSTQQQDMIARITACHHHLSDAIIMEERAVGEALAGVLDCDGFLRQVVKTLRDAPFPALVAWARRFCARQHPSAWRSDVVAAIFGMAHREALLSDHVVLPEGLTRNRFTWLLQQRATLKMYELRQSGEGFIFAEPRPGTPWRVHSLLGQVTLGAGLEYRCDAQEGQSLPLPVMGDVYLTLPDAYLTLKTDTEQITLSAMTKPSWATAIGQDTHGLFADFILNGVTQRMRWIPPGEFMMGSPSGEAQVG